MGVGDRVYYNGVRYVVDWSSEDMTDGERCVAHMRTADFLEKYGLSGAFQREMARKYRRLADASAEDR